MTTGTLQAQYGHSTEHNLLTETEFLVKPVPETNAAILAVQSALVVKNIDEICISICGLAQSLHLRENGLDSLEQYLRAQWEASPLETPEELRKKVDDCIDALRTACFNRPESDIVIQSGRETATLGQGTHFIEVSTESECDQRGLTVRDANGESSTNTTGKRLRARVTVGTGENVEVMSSNARLLIFSILHEPEQSSTKIQVGDPAHARYLEIKDDKFLAGRHFPAEMMGDPSWHELRLLPNSKQDGFEHVHPHMRLVYVTQGKGTLQTGTTPDCADQTFDLFPGKLVILTPGTWHRFSTEETGLTVHSVHPVTPTSGASANNHEMFFGTWSNATDLLNTIKRGAAR